MKLFRLTVGRKLIGLIGGLLIVSIVSIVAIATHLFVRDNISLIQQTNADSAASHATAAREAFENITQKMRFLGSLMAQTAIPAEVKTSLIRTFFEDNRIFQSVFLYSVAADGKAKLDQRAISPTQTQSGDAAGEQALSLLADSRDFSFSMLHVAEPQVALVVSENQPAVALGIPFIKTGDVVTHTLVCFLDPTNLITQFSENDLTTTYLVDKRGKLLAHPIQARIANQENFYVIPIVQDMLNGKFHNGQSRYLDPLTEVPMLGAFRLVGFAGLGVVAEVPEAKAFEAAERMRYRAMLLGLGILFLAFLGGYLFSGTIISPILELVRAVFQVSKGDFSVKLKPRGRDEIAYLSYAFSKMAVGLQERDRVKDLFGKFHNKEIADKLLSGDVKLGGERREATILFMDIRGFTTMAETLQPEELVVMLNEYMTRMVTIITSHGGVIDKYVGDAIMGVWGVPIPKGEDTANAVKACLAMRKELAELNKLRISRSQPALYIGMGLNHGHVTAGNIGSNERMEYTVIGDAVNLAARIESTTKELGTDLLVTKAVHDAVGDQFVMERCNSVVVKGKSQQIEIFKVNGYMKDGRPVIVETPYSSNILSTSSFPIPLTKAV